MKNTILKTMKFKSLLLSALAFILVFVNGCKIDNSINNSPNDIRQDQLLTVAGINGLVVGMQTMTGDFISSDHSRIASMWSGQVTSSPDAQRPQAAVWAHYALDETGPPNDMWIYGYKAVHECDDILQYAPKVILVIDSLKNIKLHNSITAIALTHKALIYGELAAMFGSIPIDLKDITQPGYTPPAFVSQADAYARVQNLLDQAISLMSKISITQDLNFLGDSAKWVQVMHSLKARYYLHVSDYSNALAQSKLGISDGTGTLFAFYSNNSLEYSPWGFWVNDEGGSIRAAKPFVDSLKSEPGDKRLAAYFSPNDNGKIVGFADSLLANPVHATDPDEQTLNTVSNILKYGGYADMFPLISFEENILIRAECEARSGDVGGAVTDVNIIRTAAGLSAFASTDANVTIAQVLKQKWLQLFLEGQSYHDMRRTKTMPDPSPGHNFRIIYPKIERNSNPNTPANSDDLARPLLQY